MDPGRPATLRLEAGECAVEVTPSSGGRVSALEIRGWDVIRRDGWTDREWGSFVMAPWVGRLREGAVAWHGRRWQMPRTEPPHALHGTVLDVPWTVVSATTESITLATGLGHEWPFEGRLTRELTLLPDRLVDRLVLRAIDQPFPAIIGWHPWFRRRAARLGDGEPSGPVEIDVRAGRRIETDDEGIPTGRIVGPRSVSLDDVLLGIDEPPIVRWPGGGPELRLHAPAAAAWIVYTGHPDGICIEPVTGLPDGLNGGLLGAPPAAAPGTPLEATFEIRW
jgi:aldose 1-epimerase